MEDYQAIYYRKSIRKYSSESLNFELLREVRKITENMNTLYPEIDLTIHLVEEGDKVQKIMSGIIGSYGKVRAPHYLVITSQEKEGYLENVGYALQKVILKLTCLGIASCWIGGSVKKDLLRNIIKMPPRHKPVLLVSFGYPENIGGLYREKAGNAKRKSVSEFVIGQLDDIWTKVFEAVRLAPSAINSQPWRFVVENDIIHVYCAKAKGLFTRNILETMNRIDIGIALSHLEIAAKYFARTITFQKMEVQQRPEMSYVISVVGNTG